MRLDLFLYYPRPQAPQEKEPGIEASVVHTGIASIVDYMIIDVKLISLLF